MKQLRICQFPSLLKCANITSVLKKGCRILKKKYKPVGILPIKSKAFGILVGKCSLKIAVKFPERILYTALFTITAWKVPVLGVILVRIFPHSDWIRRDTDYLAVFSLNVGKCGPKQLRIQTLFTQCIKLDKWKNVVNNYQTFRALLPDFSQRFDC